MHYVETSVVLKLLLTCRIAVTSDAKMPFPFPTVAGRKHTLSVFFTEHFNSKG